VLTPRGRVGDDVFRSRKFLVAKENLQRRTMRMRCFALLVGAIIFGVAPLGFSAEQNAAAISAFHDYLSKNRLDARWEGDPARLDSTEIKTAYGDRQFYFTFKAPPLPPGAALPDLIARYKRAKEEYQKHSLRLTVGIDSAQNVVPFQKAEDFNVGLMPVKSDNDARTAAAAILSLIGTERVHPGVVSAREVMVTGTNFGWRCRVSRSKGFDGTVVFDPSGRCTTASKELNYVPPMPP
jgi:hypothetical protein